ncbi:MAG: hypothetical protein IJ794_10690 [Lachnospiraceae bacterium]|nr:hypothetical protein [Lachnospiraceae bacterium]
MIALEMNSAKNFMRHLLSGDTFDLFLLEEATISTSNTFTIDGHMNTDFFPQEERNSEVIPYEFRPWSELKGLCFELIKGKYTPLFFKFVLHLKPENAAKISDGASHADKLKALILSIRFDNGKILLTTGTSYQTFVPDREIDMNWDHFVCSYLTEKGIGYEKL